MEKRKQRYDPDYMLRMLDSLYQSHGMMRPGLLRTSSDLPTVGGYSREFGSLDSAFQKLFDGERDKAAMRYTNRSVAKCLNARLFRLLGSRSEANGLHSARVTGAHGYESNWPLRRDTRQ